jgi:hypothetical protein
MRKSDVIAQVKDARAQLLAAIDGLTPELMLRVGAVGIWSVKDVLAHLSVWESELITALARPGKQPPHVVQIEDVDAFNMEQYSVNAPRPLDEVLEDFHGVHKHLLRVLEGLSEQMLTDPRIFKWMEGEPLSYLVADVAIWHEQEHAEQIATWRQSIAK